MEKAETSWKNFCRSFDFGRRIKFKNPITQKVYNGFIVDHAGSEWMIVRPTIKRTFTPKDEYHYKLRRLCVHVNDIIL